MLVAEVVAGAKSYHLDPEPIAAIVNPPFALNVAFVTQPSADLE